MIGFSVAREYREHKGRAREGRVSFLGSAEVLREHRVATYTPMAEPFSRAASALNHLNICVIYDIDESEGYPTDC